MLTIEEVRNKLIEFGSIELECIDRDGFIENDGNSFSEINRKLLKLDLKVTSVGVDSVEILGADTHIHYDEIKYFRIKRPDPTFNDLIDVAVQAVRDNLITISHLEIDNIMIESINESDSFVEYYVCDDAEALQRGIDFIKSLYTETFVIESRTDIVRATDEAEITLVNGVCGRFVKEYDDGARVRMLVDGESHKLPFFALKGATVTQKLRG